MPEDQEVTSTEEVTEDTEETAVDTETEAVAEETEEREENSSKEKTFDKKDKEDPRDEKIAELNDRVTRQMAEFENFRKRSDKEKSEMFDAGAKNVLEKILPVVDNFERALALRPEGADDAFADGMEKIYKGFQKTLSDIGVEEIESEGKEFDPEFHNAVMHVEDESLGENVIAEVLQKGYKFHDTVLRHAMVKVAN
ncbi:MAG: nucleotide exchange factor GrpE [Lachnospiraceae bacterium]|nr:nucleotide exchange factor GrpE [Lachnospiraceae bacterium]